MSFTAGPSGFGPWHWDGANWIAIPGGLMRIAAQPNGPGLVGVNVRGEIWLSAKGDGSDWTQMPGSAVDVAWGLNGISVVGTGPQ